MKFAVEHRFENIDLAGYESLYFAEDFNIALCAALKLGRTLIGLERENNLLRRAARIVPDRQIPGPVAKILGQAQLEYTEYLDYQMGSYQGTWRSVSGVLTDKITSAGSFRFTADGNAVKRLVDGEVRVQMFGVGGLIERAIVADVERSYTDAADFTRTWLAERGR